MHWDQARAAHMDIALDIKSAARSLSRAPGKGSLQREGLCALVCLGQRGGRSAASSCGDTGAAPNREITPRAGGAAPARLGLRGSAGTPHRVMSWRRSPRRGVSRVEGRRLVQPPGRAVLMVTGPAVLSAGLPVTSAVLRPGRVLFKMSAPLGGWRRCLGGTSETIPETPRFLLETQNCEMKKSLQRGLRGGAHLANGGSRCR